MQNCCPKSLLLTHNKTTASQVGTQTPFPLLVVDNQIQYDAGSL